MSQASGFRSFRLTLSRLADGRGIEERWFTRRTRQLHRTTSLKIARQSHAEAGGETKESKTSLSLSLSFLSLSLPTSLSLQCLRIYPSPLKSRPPTSLLNSNRVLFPFFFFSQHPESTCRSFPSRIEGRHVVVIYRRNRAYPDILRDDTRYTRAFSP